MYRTEQNDRPEQVAKDVTASHVYSQRILCKSGHFFFFFNFGRFNEVWESYWIQEIICGVTRLAYKKTLGEYGIGIKWEIQILFTASGD